MRSRRPAMRLRPLSLVMAVAAIVTLLLLSACGGTSDKQPSAKKTEPRVVNIGYSAIPESPIVDQFTKDTGIEINFLDEGDETNPDIVWVDWSELGAYSKGKSLVALNQYFDLTSLRSDMPLVDLFVVDGQLLALPDAAILVTTWNHTIAEQAGVTAVPKTIAEYTRALKQVKAKGVCEYPLNSPFGEPNRLWYVAAAAFGGTILDGNGAPAFTEPDSGGYLALQWMVDAYRDGLVPTDDSNEMRFGYAVSMLADYPMQGFYDVSSYSGVQGQVDYIPTPGVNGPIPNLAVADGTSIPATSKNQSEAAEFLKWYTSTEIMAQVAAPPDGEPNVPGRISAAELLVKSGSGQRSTEQMIGMLRTVNLRWLTPDIVPPIWFREFEDAAIVELQAAISGKQTVRQTIDRMAAKAEALQADE